MRIAIIGAGVAGLVAAVALQSDGHTVHVFEQRENPNAEGAGLTLFGNALAALDTVGLGATIRQISHTELGRYTTGQRTPRGRWLMTMPPASVQALYTVHRVTLHNALLSLLSPDSLHTHTLATVADNGAPVVHWQGPAASGELAADLVVIADGIRSSNRGVLGLDPGLRYGGYTAWRGVTQRPVELRGQAAETWGSGAIFGYTPLPDDQVYWFGTLSTPPETELGAPAEAVAQLFGQWHDPIPACLAATDPGQILRHDVYELAKPLRALHRGSAVLLGDAAHAMLPNLGQGAGQGIEDAVTLALLLRDATVDNLTGVLERYTALRRPRTTLLWRQSRQLARIAQAAGPLATVARNTAMRLAPAPLVGPVTQRLNRWVPPHEQDRT